jgi:hypothetical protein
MKSLNLKEKEVFIKDSLQNVTIADFEKLLTITNVNKYEDEIDKQVEILSVLTNLNIDELESLELADFLELNNYINKLNLNDFNLNENQGINDFIFINKIYRAKSLPKDFKLNVKEMKIIKNEVKISELGYLSKLAAIIYRDVLNDDSLDNDLTDETILYKSNIFKDNMTMDFIAPYLLTITDYLLENDKHTKILG